MGKLKILQLDPVGLIINETFIEVDYSSSKEGSLPKSRFFIFSEDEIVLANFKVYDNDTIEIRNMTKE